MYGLETDIPNIMDLCRDLNLHDRTAIFPTRLTLSRNMIGVQILVQMGHFPPLVGPGRIDWGKTLGRIVLVKK